MASSSDGDSKVFDVSKPGKTAPSASGRPVIVGHKNILKEDPMVKAKEIVVDLPPEDQPSGNPAPAETDDDPAAKSTKQLKIQPPAGSDVAKDDKSAQDETVSDAKPAESDKTDSSDGEVSDKPVTETGNIVEEEQETTQAKTGDSDAAQTEHSDDPSKKSKKDGKDVPEQTAQQQAIEKLIDSKEYFVPIGKQTRQKRSIRRILIIAIAAILILAIAGWYLTKPAKTPPTVDNSAQTSSNPTTAPTTKIEAYKRTTTVPSDWKTYTNSKYKISLAYPNDWTISTNTINKKTGEDTQNAYSLNATEIFVICYKQKPSDQYCTEQININNQSFDKSLAQLRSYYAKNPPEPVERQLLFDGHKTSEFRTEKSGKESPAQKEYLVSANGYTYDSPVVYEGNPIDTGLTAQKSLILFESVKID